MILPKYLFYIITSFSFFGEGATISEIMKTTKKSRGTIQNRLDNIPKTHLIINNKIKPYRYKLNMMLFREK